MFPTSPERTARRAVMALAFIAGVAQAQTTETGVLRGRVQDASGQPLGNTDITVEQLDGSYRRRSRSDSSTRTHSQMTSAAPSRRIASAPPRPSHRRDKATGETASASNVRLAYPEKKESRSSDGSGFR